MTFAEVLTRKRQVIPRWHTYPLARWLGVNVSAEVENIQASPDEDYREKKQSWQNTPKLAHAADLVGSALMLNCFDDDVVKGAASYILKHKTKASNLLIDLAETYVHLSRKQDFPLPDLVLPEEIQKLHHVISRLRAKTRDYPRNPILWMDLGFYYSSIGQTHAAQHAVNVALGINKENRYLLRSGARFYMHIDDPDAALHYLRQSMAGKYDPWLVAAEIAISDTQDATSRRIKLARNMLESGDFANFHLSELASALGTIELKNGSRRKGKKLISLALESPTENTLAQVAFLQDIFGEPIGIVSKDLPAQSFEAQSRLKFQIEDFQGALEASKKWFAYQPFSSRPALFGSYVAAVALDDFNESIKIAKMGLVSSPQDFTLKNNLAFGLASLGKPEEAAHALVSVSELELTESEKSVLTATRATIAFREGKVEVGRELYKKAIEEFRKQKQLRAQVLAMYFRAREEMLVKSPAAKALEAEALASAEKQKVNELLARGHFKRTLQ